MEDQLQSFLKELEENLLWISDTELLLNPQMNPQKELVEVFVVRKNHVCYKKSFLK